MATGLYNHVVKRMHAQTRLLIRNIRGMIVEHTETQAETLNNVHEQVTNQDGDNADGNVINDPDLAQKLDRYSLEAIVDLKISRFLDQIGTYYPENLHALIMRKTEKPLLEVLR